MRRKTAWLSLILLTFALCCSLVTSDAYAFFIKPEDAPPPKDEDEDMCDMGKAAESLRFLVEPGGTEGEEWFATLMAEIQALVTGMLNDLGEGIGTLIFTVTGLEEAAGLNESFAVGGVTVEIHGNI